METIVLKSKMIELAKILFDFINGRTNNFDLKAILHFFDQNLMIFDQNLMIFDQKFIFFDQNLMIFSAKI